MLDPSDNKNVIYSTYGVFPGYTDDLKVIYVGGYIGADLTTTNIPDYVKHAATQQVLYLFKNRKNVGLDNISIGDGVIQKVNNSWFLPEVQDVIRKLRIRNVY